MELEHQKRIFVNWVLEETDDVDFWQKQILDDETSSLVVQIHTVLRKFHCIEKKYSLVYWRNRWPISFYFILRRSWQCCYCQWRTFIERCRANVFIRWLWKKHFSNICAVVLEILDRAKSIFFVFCKFPLNFFLLVKILCRSNNHPLYPTWFPSVTTFACTYQIKCQIKNY